MRERPQVHLQRRYKLLNIRGTGGQPPSDPVLFMTDDEISEGSAKPGSPLQRFARKLGTYEWVVQPNHVETVVAKIEVDGEQHLVKLSRYRDNQQFWTVPGVRDKRLYRRNKIVTVTEPRTSTNSTTSLGIRWRSITSRTRATPMSDRACRSGCSNCSLSSSREAPRADYGSNAGIPAAR